MMPERMLPDDQSFLELMGVSGEHFGKRLVRTIPHHPNDTLDLLRKASFCRRQLDYA